MNHFFLGLLVEDHGTCNSSPCINEGTCINTGRSYRCECSRGYYGQECQFGMWNLPLVTPKIDVKLNKKVYPFKDLSETRWS